VTVSSKPDFGSKFELTILQHDEAQRVGEPAVEQDAKPKGRSLAA
jgi:hypothetical protein